MKVTAADLELQSRFVDYPNAHGFGTTQSDAKLNNKQIDRLLKLKLIKVCRAVRCEGLTDHNGFKRSGTHYCKNSSE